VIVDYHMHLRRAGNESDAIELTDHSLPAVERYVEAARAVGVDEIGVSEHVYYFTATRDLWHIPYQLGKCVCDVDAYVEAIAAAKRRGLPVKLGVEVDFDPERIDDMRAWLDRQPWDYVLGSVHFVDDFGVDSRPRLIDEVGLDSDSPSQKMGHEHLGKRRLFMEHANDCCFLQPHDLAFHQRRHIRQVLAELKVGAFLGKRQQPFRLLTAELGFRSFHGAPRPTQQSNSTPRG